MPVRTPDGATVWFLSAAAAYFALQAGLRVAMGGTLEVDEAEILLLSQGWAWGYGPQLPLYNWAQVAVFALFGSGTAGLAILKGAVLWLAAAGMWFGMRAAFGPGRAAAAAALSLALLPNVLWEFQRSSTHSIALLAAMTWTFWAWFTTRDRPTLRHWIAFGVILGLGGLSKYNYWAVPVALALADLRGGPRRPRGLLVALAIAVAILAVPYAWVIANPAESLASVQKLYPPTEGPPPWAQGLYAAVEALVGGLALPLLAGGLLWAATGRRRHPMPQAAGILLRAAGLTAAAVAVSVVVLGVSDVQARWLVPVMVMATAGAFGWLGAGLSRRAFAVVPALALACAALTGAGMARHRATGMGSVDLAPLIAMVKDMDPDRIDGEYLFAGNLKMLLPDRDITAGEALPGEPGVLFLGRGPPAASPGTAARSGVLQLTYHGDPERRMPVHWRMVP